MVQEQLIIQARKLVQKMHDDLDAMNSVEINKINTLLEVDRLLYRLLPVQIVAPPEGLPGRIKIRRNPEY